MLVIAGVISCANILIFGVFPVSPPPGNAALVLRSRLKVKVVKEHREKSPVQNGIEENGVVPANLEKEVGKQIMQYQVRGQSKPNLLFGICIYFIKTLSQQCGAGPCCSNSECALNAEELLHTFPLCSQKC